jgi:hypothetical protein
MGFECASAGCGLRVVVGASSKFATSQSETGDQTRALKCSLSARAILGDHHAFTTCVHTCTTHLSAIWILVCKHVHMNRSYLIYAYLALISS